MTYSRLQLNQLRLAAQGAAIEFVPHTPPWMDAAAWLWAAKYMLGGNKFARFLSETYCEQYLSVLKAGRVMYQ